MSCRRASRYLIRAGYKEAHALKVPGRVQHLPEEVKGEASKKEVDTSWRGYADIVT